MAKADEANLKLATTVIRLLKGVVTALEDWLKAKQN